MEKYTIYKRNGDIDCELEDGIYDVTAKITIKNGEMKYIDNGIWKRTN